MRRTSFAPPRRRRSRLPVILIMLFVLLVGGAIWLSTIDTEVEPTRIEQDVTNDIQGG
jgi:cytochrome c-type biogenesis protein CcmE